MNSSRRSADWLAVSVILLVAVAYTIGVLWHRAQLGGGGQSYDIYAENYPGIVYMLRAVREGHGFFWNRLQNCGVPFIPNSQMGTLYPLNLLFFIFSIPTGYFVLCALHFTVGGVGTYLLCRHYDLKPTAALCGAIAFAIGQICIYLGTWLPTTILGAYIWIPLAVFCCERILETPTATRGICLGLVLTVQLLLAYPQTSFFTYQFLALRILWELGSRRTWPSLDMLRALGIGFVLPPLLGAVSFIPSLEFVRGSVRGQGLGVKEISVLSATWSQFRASIAGRAGGDAASGTVFTMIPTALIGFALVGSRRVRITAFYAFAAVLYIVLSFDNSVSEFYRGLPLGSTFRDPTRFLWMTGFALNVLVALGADAAMGVGEGVSKRVRLAAGGVAGVLACCFLGQTTPLPWEWSLLATGAAALVYGAWSKQLLWAVALPALVAINLWIVGQYPFLTYLKDESWPYRDSDAFNFVKSKLTLQDRMYQLGGHPNYAIMPRSGMMHDVPSVTDYEPQATQRIASLWTWVLTDAPMKDISQFYYPMREMPSNRPLLDLLATRYIVIDTAKEDPRWFGKPGFQQIWSRGKLLVYENRLALPRAFFVPRIEVVADPEMILQRLATGAVDPQRTALVESVPEDGFVGRNPYADGYATIVSDRSELVQIHVWAEDEGFLFLSDQVYPGWEVTVNEVPTPITRADYAFRVVRVPAGSSEIVFRYRPWSVRIGAMVTLATALVLMTYAVLRLRSRRASRAQPA